MKTFTFIISLLVLFTACEKDETTNDQTSTEVMSYFPTTVGSYWVYEVKKIDENGNFVESTRDCVIVEPKEEIGNQDYHYYKHFSNVTHVPWLDVYFYDSQEYIVNKTGNKIFALYHHQDTINVYHDTTVTKDTLYTVYTIMSEAGDSVVVPADTFRNVITAEQHTYLYPEHFPNQTNHDFIGYHKYKKGVGTVYFEYIYTSGYKLEFSLIEHQP